MSNINWGTQAVESEDPLYWKTGELNLWCKTVSNELWLAYQHIQSNNIEADPRIVNHGPVSHPPEEIAWHRWILKNPFEKIQFIPIFPDRPVVVKPEYDFRMAYGAKTKIYLYIPIWVKIKLGDKMIMELPTKILSKTWFGNFDEGELSYWLSSPIRKSVESAAHYPYLAICPMEVINRSNDELLVDKICYRVRKLSLFSLDNQLWSDQMKVKYRGQNEVSEISVSRKTPSEALEALLISKSRDDIEKGFTAKTFYNLKELPGFNFLNR